MVRRLSIREDEVEPPRFLIEGEHNRRYRRFNAVGTQLTVKMLPPSAGTDTDPLSHFIASVTDLFEYALRDFRRSDMVGINICNQVNVQDKMIGISFRRKEQLTENVIRSVFEKVAQSNARFNALDQLIVEEHSVRMPVGFGGV
jgi:hypothetical protein